MAKLKLDDLKKIQDKVKASTALREGGTRARVTIHMGTCGIAAGARKVMQALMDEVGKRNLTDVIVTTSGCAGLCSREPMATVEIAEQAPVKYVDLDESKIIEVLDEHVVNGRVLDKYAFALGSERTY